MEETQFLLFPLPVVVHSVMKHMQNLQCWSGCRSLMSSVPGRGLAHVEGQYVGGLGVDELMAMQMLSVMSLHADLGRRGLLLRAISPANQQQQVPSTCGCGLPRKGREERGGKQGGPESSGLPVWR